MALRLGIARGKSILGWLGLVLCLYWLTRCQSPFGTPASISPAATPQPIRIPGESTLNLTELWRFHTGQVNASYHSAPPNFYITNGKVIFSYLADEEPVASSDSILVALSLETGQPVWQTCMVTHRLGSTSVSSSHLDGKRLYLTYAFQAHAFSLETGEWLWSTPDPKYPGGHTGYMFRPWDSTEPLLWHSDRDEVIALDPRTGDILYRQPEASVWSHIQKDQIDLVDVAEYEKVGSISTLVWQGLRAVDLQTGQMLWEYPGGYYIKRWPSFVEDDIVFQLGRLCYSIVRADVRTGQVIWQTDFNYLSQNFAIVGTRLYALREDLTLVAFDLGTGTVVGTLKFNGPPAETVCGKPASAVYWVIAEGPYVAVYFGDSEELIALGP
jgi:outer membrane protein assembly factor BamB